MTKEDILRIALVVGWHSAILLHIYDGREGALTDQELAELQRLERFFRLAYEAGAAAEREACAKLAETTVCDTHLPTGVQIYGSKAAAVIRARGNK